MRWNPLIGEVGQVIVETLQSLCTTQVLLSAGTTVALLPSMHSLKGTVAPEARTRHPTSRVASPRVAGGEEGDPSAGFAGPSQGRGNWGWLLKALVSLVSLVYLVCLVSLVSLVSPVPPVSLVSLMSLVPLVSPASRGEQGVQGPT